MQNRNIVISEIKSDIIAILTKGDDNKQTDEEKVFDLSILRAGLFKAGYGAREINATIAGYIRRGLMKPAIALTEGQYIFSKKLYEQ